MTFRVTQTMLNTQMLRNLNNNMLRMDNLQNQLSTGRKINKPSDDPVGISYAMRYRSELSANDQYQRNLDSAVSWLDYTDTMLDQAGQVIQRARELTVQAANGTNPQAARDAIKSEIDQLYEQMVNIGNSQLNGKFIFNGQMTNKEPYASATATTTVTDNGPIAYEIGAGVRVPINVSGNEVFGNVDTTTTPPTVENDNIFKVLKDLSGALASGNQTGIQNALGLIDSRFNKFLEIRSDIGAKSNRLELAGDRLKDININLQSLQSKTEDADMAAVITNLKTEENVYQSSLSAGSKIIQPSLADFLR